MGIPIAWDLSTKKKHLSGVSVAGFPWKGRKQSKYPKVGIIDCGLRLNWNERKDKMAAMGRFMGSPRPLR